MDEEFIKLISDFQKIPKIKRTFMEISGYPHYENVCSNILEFFFDTKNEHNLKDLFIKSLLQAIDPNQDIHNEIEEVKVEREVYTENNKRIDLVLETDELVIGIENKIFASLYNDLNDYSVTIDAKREGTKKVAIKIVLSLKEIDPTQITSGFQNIIYKDFFYNIKKNLGDYILEGDNDYILHLKEFIITLLNQNGETMVNKEMYQFCEKNFNRIQELLLEFNKFKGLVLQKINHLKESIDVGIPVRNSIKEWIFDKNCLVFDYEIQDNNDKYFISIDTYLHPVDGWEIQLFGRDGDSINYLNEFMCTTILSPPFQNYTKNKDRRIIIGIYSINNFKEVKSTLIDLLKSIEEYKIKQEN